MSRPEAVAGPEGLRHTQRTGAPLRVVAERLSPDAVGAPESPAAVVPRARAAGGTVIVATSPVLVPPPGVPAPPLAAVTPEIAAAAPLPVLAPRPRRGRLRMLLRMWIPARRGGRHRTDAPHLQAAWSMFAPLRDERRRRGLR